MRLNNKSIYQTEAIRKLLYEAIKRWRKTEGQSYHLNKVRVDVINARSAGHESGYAYLNSTWMKVRLPHPFKKFGYDDVDGHFSAARQMGKELSMISEEELERTRTPKKNWTEWRKAYEIKYNSDPKSQGWIAYGLVYVFYHELMHNLGHHHATIPNNILKEESEWAKTWPLPIAQPELIERLSRDEIDKSKVSQLQARRRKWETKLKRAHTAIKKINRQIQYYERKNGLQKAA